MSTTRKRTHGRALGALTTTLMLALLAALLLAGSALAAGHEGPGGKSAAKPGRPTAKAPSGTMATATPTFTWSKARGATRYEVRVYEGSTLLLHKTGIKKLSWQSSKALPTNVALTWKVRAGNAAGAGAWSRSLTFRIVPPSPEKALTAFSFQGLTPPATGVILETLHTVALTVPAGTNVTALVATFATTGVSVAIAGTLQASGTTANNFSNPVTYTVTAGDGTTQAYVVTVTVATPAKAITAFSFQGLSPPVIGTINDAAHTISLTVPAGTDVTALVATFTTTGASVAIEGTPQVSGLTANNFTNPVPYTVTAGDASTGGYTVTVTFAPLAIGDSYQGGKIAYIDATGQHGLIVAAADQNAGVSIAWSNITATLVGTGTDLGAGQANTTAIVGQVVGGVSCTSGAAYLCDQLVELGYHDWYLPSKDELNQMYVNRVAIGGVWSAGYWSSSEVNATIAWGRNFDSGNQGNYEKRITARVRAVRSF